MAAQKKAIHEATKARTKGERSGGFSAEEKAAMRERAQELKAEARGAITEREVLAKIEAMAEPDRSMGKKLHVVVKASAPGLSPKLWYGMPAYAKDGKVVCYFQSGKKFKTRYSTFGFTDEAKLDEGAMWPTAFALTRLTAADWKKIGTLVKTAVS